MSSGGIGLGTATALVFTTLKLTDHIDWSWLWVLSPVWIPLTFALGIYGLLGLCVAIGHLTKSSTWHK